MLYLGFSNALHFSFYCFQILKALFLPQDPFGVHHLSSFWCMFMFCCPALHGLLYFPESGHLEVNSRVCLKVFSFLIFQDACSEQEKDTWVSFRTHSPNCNRMFVFLCIHKGLVSNGFSCCQTQVLTLIAFLGVTLS